MNCFFLHCHPISYFIIHVCNQIIDKHSKMTKCWYFQTSPYQRLKSNFRILHLIPIFLVLMSYTNIRKDENKLSIIDLTSYSQSDHILGENSLQLVVKSVKILFSMWEEKLKILMEWTAFSFIAILFLIS